jgi:hypothetical protein
MTIHSCRVCHYSWVQFTNGTWWPDKKKLCEHVKILLVPYVP